METRDELLTACNPKFMSLTRCLSAPDATSLHHCLKNKQLKLIWFYGNGPSIYYYAQLRRVWVILAIDGPCLHEVGKALHLLD